ncbi:MAG: response regulator transcription factor [Verrucomicrobiota bacterium]|nr:response regulator transcription factor [Verrucomicrobiota bacterium]
MKTTFAKKGRPARRQSPVKSGKRTVLLVDDHPVVGVGLTERINRESDFGVCGVAQTGAEAMTAITRLQPDVVVLDLALPSGHGLEVLRDIHSQHPRLPVLVFSMHEESVYAERALRAGARGYLMKHEPPERLLEAIRALLSGGFAFSRETSARLLETLSQPAKEHPGSLVAKLGNRELEVFQFIGRGKTTREIAGLLGLSVKTIETYRDRIKQKLNAHSSTDLIRQAVCWVETGV